MPAKKVYFPPRIQGTDGIRRTVLPSDDPSLAGLNPAEAFVERDVLTEKFMEGYAFAFGKTLRERPIKNPRVVIAWDPRDPEGLFTGAVIRGIRKAGCVALIAGVAPTPAVPMYVAAGRADGGLMITASHNPAEQNGIKVFLAPTGLKLLHKDDVALTERIAKLDWEALAAAEPAEDEKGIKEEIRDLFVRFHTEPGNAWLDDGGLSRFTLVVDPARGAYTNLAADVLSYWGAEVHEVNADAGDGRVNHLSGVADLEGFSEIPIAECISGRWRKYSALAKTAELARTRSHELEPGGKVLAATVFDSDGDRFFLLLYRPSQESIAVLSGDECAILQGQFLRKRYGGKITGSGFLNTVESDLGVSDAAAGLGLAPVLKPVGDKWILLDATCRLLKYAGRTAPGEVRGRFRETAESIDAGEPASAASISGLLEEAAPYFPSACENDSPGLALRFAVGCEETGHAITFGSLEAPHGLIPFAAGNGLKSALNTLAAVADIAEDAPKIKTALKIIADPFKRGIKANRYVYFTQKEKLFCGAEFAAELKKRLMSALTDAAPSLVIKPVHFPEEPEMIYLAGYEGERQVTAAFARNSGTEDKSCLYLRAVAGYEETAEAVINGVYPWFYAGLKDGRKQRATQELEVLHMLAAGHAVRFPEDVRQEMEMILIDKEGLLERENLNLKLTPLGYRVVEFLDSE
jgi:phosphoglucosamine mutase